MTKGPRTDVEYEREIAEIMERFIDSGREFATLADPNDWRDFVQDKIFGYHGAQWDEQTEDFYERARETIAETLDDSDIKFAEFTDAAGVERTQFRDTTTGRFVSVRSVKDFIIGFLKGPFG